MGEVRVGSEFRWTRDWMTWMAWWREWKVGLGGWNLCPLLLLPPFPTLMMSDGGGYCVVVHALTDMGISHLSNLEFFQVGCFTACIAAAWHVAWEQAGGATGSPFPP